MAPVDGRGARLPQLPGLDGLRGLALLGVLGFHGGVSWLRGGYLPLTTFFVLSGFLITSLILVEWQGSGRVDWRGFWTRRLRRLAPAGLLGIVLAAGLVAAGAGGGPDLKGDALSVLGWVTNWRFIVQDRSYADVVAGASPLEHFWSLAVEEQLYLVLAILAMLLLVPARSRRYFAAAIAAIGALSVLQMASVHHPGDAPLRAYFGTDARAAELLTGALLSCALIGPRGLRALRPRLRHTLDVVAFAALVTTLGSWVVVRQFDDWLFEGGLVLLAICVAVVVAAATQPTTLVSRALGVAPLGWLGRVSYGAYVFHWPIFQWLSPERAGVDGVGLFAMRVGATLGLATVSLAVVERPIRNGALRSHVGALSWANGAVAALAVATLAFANTPVSGITLRAEEALPPPPPSVPTTVAPVAPPPATDAPLVRTDVAGRQFTRGTEPPRPSPTVAPPPPPVRVLVVGDSLADNLAFGLDRWNASSHQLLVWNHGVGGCPLGRGGERRQANGKIKPARAQCEWWGSPEAAAEVAQFDPDVVLVVTGLNDLYDRKLPTWPDWLAAGDPVFDAWLLSEYQSAVDVLGATGAAVLWAPPPCVDWLPWALVVDPTVGEARRLHHNNVTVPGLMATRPAVVADLEAQLCPNGQFDRNALGITGSRPDGLHLTDEATEELARRWLGPLVVAAKR